MFCLLFKGLVMKKYQEKDNPFHITLTLPDLQALKVDNVSF